MNDVIHDVVSGVLYLMIWGLVAWVLIDTAVKIYALFKLAGAQNEVEDSRGESESCEARR